VEREIGLYLTTGLNERRRRLLWWNGKAMESLFRNGMCELVQGETVELEFLGVTIKPPIELMYGHEKYTFIDGEIELIESARRTLQTSAAFAESPLGNAMKLLLLHYDACDLREEAVKVLALLKTGAFDTPSTETPRL
jgi:hypothetical protein